MSAKYYPESQKRGQRIREMRKKKGITGQQLAKAVDTNTSTISRYEAGVIKHIREPLLEAIARCLDTDIDYLNTGKAAQNLPVSGQPQEAATLASPALPYQRVFKQSQAGEILSEAEGIRELEPESGKSAGPGCFVIEADEDIIELRILREDYLLIQPCKHLVPEKVNLVLDSSKKICFFRALKMENATLLKISDREAVSDANLAKYGLTLIGYCVKLERKNV